MKCEVEGCTRPGKAKGLCLPHYLKKRKYGDPLCGGTREEYHEKLREEHESREPRQCCVKDCTEPVKAMNLCSRHYQQKRDFSGLTTAHALSERRPVFTTKSFAALPLTTDLTSSKWRDYLLCATLPWPKPPSSPGGESISTLSGGRCLAFRTTPPSLFPTGALSERQKQIRRVSN